MHGAIVSRTSHVKKCRENSCTNLNLCSESPINDLSSDGTKNGENSQVGNHHKNLIDSISRVKHENFTKIFKQQDSLDSSTSTKSSDVPDLEVLPVYIPCYSTIQNHLPFLLPSNQISPRSGAIQTIYKM